MCLLDSEVREDPGHLRGEFPPVKGHRVPMGDVFTSCNWVMRDGCVMLLLIHQQCEL